MVPQMPHSGPSLPLGQLGPHSPWWPAQGPAKTLEGGPQEFQGKSSLGRHPSLEPWSLELDSLQKGGWGRPTSLPVLLGAAVPWTKSTDYKEPRPCPPMGEALRTTLRVRSIPLFSIFSFMARPCTAETQSRLKCEKSNWPRKGEAMLLLPKAAGCT